MNSYDPFPDGDPWDTPCIGQPIQDLLAKSLEPREGLHPWLPSGLTLLGGKTKAGKSTFAEQIAEEVSLEKKVLYLALEYNERMAQGRFKRFTELHQVHIVVEGQMDRMGKGGEDQFDDLLFKYKPELVIVDILAKLKRHNTGHYDAEYQAMTEIKELIDKHDKDCLVLTHSGKPTANDSDDPFDKIIGSTALQGVPDNLMVLAQSNGHTKLNTKGRLIYPSELILDFKDGVYAERLGIAAELEDKAPLQAEILKLLQENDLRVSDIENQLRRSGPQISSACQKLFNEGRITRDNRTLPYRLVENRLL